jgi:hypothetical protein
MMSQWFTDPAERYLQVAQMAPTGELDSRNEPAPELDSAALLDVIQTASDSGKPVAPELAAHIAKHSPLTEAEAMPLVTVLEARHKTPEKLAAATSGHVSRKVSGAVSLSDPAMLGPLPRLIASGVLAAALLMSVVYAHALPRKPSGWAYGAFMFIAASATIGILVLVMGYKNVKIKGAAGG